MAEEYLQAAFEIKAACDDISRKLLRWHWEQKPGAHSVDALLKHLAQRQKESPDYYERLPELSGRTSWQQLDTTLCMRVLLDPEKDAARPLDLLGDTPRPAAARRACNAVRMARNEAAHASDKTAAAQAALRFNEAVEELEAGYKGTALTTGDLEKYYRMAEDFLARCGASETIEPQKKAGDEPPRRPKSQTPRADAPARKHQSSGDRTASRGTSGRSRKTSGKTGRSPPQKASAHPEPCPHGGAAGRRSAGPAGPGMDDGTDEIAALLRVGEKVFSHPRGTSLIH